DGPYNLLGWSFGGLVAHELAIELRRRGQQVQHLVLLDPGRGADDTTVTDQAPEHSQIEDFILDQLLQFNQIDIPEQSKPLTYAQLEAIVGQEQNLILPRRPLFDFMVQKGHANQILRRKHLP
ncbi:thioesterase domain-containing protein, partial [Mycobacteroides abscessus]|uniref:thioesterase domain-containing protein n=1 Tax=Mycobacteroides abscessus TaxID=36809 RepID=UPI001F5E2DB3